ncbi:MAG: hypothetical protein LQ352_003461 [Teloschistes flavicans]|nr:MAG: hypothetical protein LQ352_003461 [Teloschistes flavicans]
MERIPRPSRLKAAKVDPLDNLGFISKGDTSLLDHKRQEDYFDIIKTRFAALAHISASPDLDNDSLVNALDTLSLSHNAAVKSIESSSLQVPKATSSSSISASAEFFVLIVAMRKLREAIVASRRRDMFARAVYLFIIRTTIMLGHPESYHPALLYLFRCIHPSNALSNEEEFEFVGYLILDVACRLNDLASAFHLRCLYKYRSQSVDTVLSALVHGDWMQYWDARISTSAYERHLMQWADERMAVHALQCLGKSYLAINKTFLERCAGREWKMLRDAKMISWVLDGERVIIKQIKKK